MPDLHELVVEKSLLDVSVRITFVSRGELRDAQARQIRAEIEEAVAGALASRGLSVWSVDDFQVTVEPASDVKVRR